MLNKINLIFILFLILACNNIKSKETKVELQQDNTHNQVTKSTNSIGEILTPEAKKLVVDWKEYEVMDEMLSKFYVINTEDALLEAKTLSIAAQQLKDSIRIKQFERPDIKIRLNVFYNNTLRLADMQTISSIEVEEIKLEITNILNAFSAINSKINNLTNQKYLEKQLINFENN